MIVRAMQSADLSAVAELSEQLGYPVSDEDLTRRFGALGRSDHHYLIVALCEDVVVAWCHVFHVALLETDGYAELGGLVVDENWRRKGIARALVSEAEAWAGSRDLLRIRAHSGLHREIAHEFYRAEGFEQSAPAMFQKVLD